MADHTTNGAASLLHGLLARRDRISIERGQLVIQPASGLPVPADWQAKHYPALIQQILSATEQDAYRYCSYGTGRYGPKRVEGLTMKFQSVTTRQEFHVFFNVMLTRARTTSTGAEGEPLPKSQFRIGENHQLYHCWQSTDLEMPRRLSAMHDYMGNLRGILFSASLTKSRADNRLNASTLVALNIPASVILQAVLADKSRTKHGQGPDNFRTSAPDKGTAQGQHSRGMQAFSGTCKNIHDKTVISKRDDTVAPFPQPSRKTPQEQSVDEWTADLEGPRL